MPLHRAVAAVLAMVVGVGASAADQAAPACATQGQPLAWRAGPGGKGLLATVDAGPLLERRIWIDAASVGARATPSRIPLWLVFDPKPDGSMGFAQGGELFVPAGTGAHTTLTGWISRDIHEVGVEVPAESADDARRLALRLRCSQEAQHWAEPSSQQALLDEMLALYFGNAVHAPADPAHERRMVQGWATGATSSDDVAWAVRLMLFMLHDPHSYVVPADERTAFFAMLAPTPPVVRLRDDGLALVAISQVAFDDADSRRRYARALHAQIARVAAHHPRGWILDLRGCGGGDMWTMLAGLSALVDGPLVGEFVSRSGRDPWLVGAGHAGTAASPDIVDIGTRDRTRVDAPIAVLIGPGTTSSGEATAIAFERQSRTRFFGQATLGLYNTGIVQHMLSDGTMFGVAQTLSADRTGHVYDGPIVPDTEVAERDDPVKAAAAWLLSLPR